MKLIDAHTLILASKSPRRKDLLEQLGLKIKIVPSDINEDEILVEEPVRYAQRLAMEKALAIGNLLPDAYILAADTIVVAEDMILGKPGSDSHAFEMLKTLNGSEHIVITGFCICHRQKAVHIVKSVKTSVRFKACTDQELRWYIKTKEPFGKAGAYAIQGVGAFLVESITGSYTNVVGLPVCEVVKEMNQLKILQF